MTTHKWPGFCAVFEGINGSGKSSAITSVAKELGKHGKEVVLTREPGGSPLAEDLRRMLLDPTINMDPHEQTLLFMAARRNHLRTVILPALARGAIVLCDRFVASTLVFQTLRPEGTAPLSVQEVVNAHKQWCWDVAPDVQFVLELPISVAAQRRRNREASNDRFESEDLIYEQACADRFLESGNLLDFRQVNVDATQSPSAVADRILKTLTPIVEDKAISVVSFRLTDGRRGRWFPFKDPRGRAWWTHDPSEAHAIATRISHEGFETKLIKRSAAINAMQYGLTTEDVQDARP